MSFDTWNVWSLYRSGSLSTTARELARHKLYLGGVQTVKWDTAGPVRAGDFIFFYGKGNEDYQLGTGCFVHHRIVSAVKRVEFVSDRTSYIVLKVRWCNIIALNVQAPTEKKINFYEELEQVFDHFPKYHMKEIVM